MLNSLLLTVVALTPAPARADSILWRIDPGHSEVSFRIRHFVTKVRGRFSDFAGSIVADPAKLDQGRVTVTIQAASINTANDRRDADLRSPNHFSVDSFPTLTFASKKVELKGDRITITGDLTMRDVTKEVVLTGDFTGVIGNPAPRQQRMGFSVTTRINRLDWGLKWNRVVEGSGVMLGDDVDIEINVEAVRQ